MPKVGQDVARLVRNAGTGQTLRAKKPTLSFKLKVPTGAFTDFRATFARRPTICVPSVLYETLNFERVLVSDFYIRGIPGSSFFSCLELILVK